MIENVLEVIDVIISNPIESLFLFGIGYVVYRLRNARSRKRFHYDINEQRELWSFDLFPARERYEYPEYYLKKDQEEK